MSLCRAPLCLALLVGVAAYADAQPLKAKEMAVVVVNPQTGFALIGVGKDAEAAQAPAMQLCRQDAKPAEREQCRVAGRCEQTGWTAVARWREGDRYGFEHVCGLGSQEAASAALARACAAPGRAHCRVMQLAVLK
ncbi:MAG: hypothetical protein HY744_28735 [Deltaproteobacteria bacterium]|nr:hypothetical protein [Deltaproteobacteria bacterium]